MPDDFDASRGMRQTAQRGFPRGGFPRGGVRRGFPMRGFPRGGFPQRFPVRRPFPAPIIYPFFFGFPRQRCYWVDQFGRCCDQFGRCYYLGGYPYGPYAGQTAQDGWYGVPGSWDMVADMDASYDDMESVVAYIDDDDF